MLAYSEPAFYSPVTLSLDGKPIAVNPGTTPRGTYTATVQLTAGQTYTLDGPVQKLTWVTPSQITNDIDQAVGAAKRATAAVVVVGDGQESEGGDRVDLALPADQDQLVEAVAGVNKHTVVVIDAGGPVTMPWLGEVSSVVDAWYPGQTNGSALAAVLVGDVDPSGHLPMTFPTATTASPVSSPAQFPGTDGRVDYSEGVDVGYRWYDATGTTPLFPFGFGLSYTTFLYSNPEVRVQVRDGRPQVTASVLITNTGNTSGTDVAQLYLGNHQRRATPRGSWRHSIGYRSSQACPRRLPSPWVRRSLRTTTRPVPRGESLLAPTTFGWATPRLSHNSQRSPVSLSPVRSAEPVTITPSI